MTFRKLNTSFDSVGKHEIGPLAQNCLTHTTGNPHFPNAKPFVDTMQADLTPYLAAASIAHPTPTQTAELARLRTTLNHSLGALAGMANALFPTNEAALLSTGLSLSKEHTRHTVLEAPTKFVLADGPQLGTLSAKAKRPLHAVAMKYLFSLDPNAPDSEWYVLVVRDGEVVFTNCVSGDKVYSKVAAVGGDTDQQPFSDVLSRIVQ